MLKNSFKLAWLNLVKDRLFRLLIMLKKYSLLLVLVFSQHAMYSQTIQPDLQDTTQWKVVNRRVDPITENGKKGVQFSEAPGIGLMILKGSDFSNGSIEMDMKGSNKPQQSFIGFAFHGQGLDVYDAVYFRPFNFKSEDTIHRSHTVQYISMPDYDWEKLRNDFPGKYENKIEPAPGGDEWFHVKIIVNGNKVSVFVNGQQQAALQVEKLNTNSKGGFGLWVGNNSGGSFANLTITSAGSANSTSQTTPSVPYGNNPAAGHYFNVGDAKLYYEIYGQGKPMVLLHGGVYGYIDEFEPFIQKLSQHYQVICIATRGHGKSEIGHSPFTYKQRAEDAYKVIRSITRDSVLVLGFSALKLAALHPDLVSKLIAIGAGDYPKTRTQKKENYTPQRLLKNDSAFFAGRLALMPEPDRWRESLEMVSKMYNEDYVSNETFGKIKCPALIMAGDKDDNNKTEDVVKCARAISNAQLSIIPGCYHVVFFCNFPAVWEAVQPFLSQR